MKRGSVILKRFTANTVCCDQVYYYTVVRREHISYILHCLCNLTLMQKPNTVMFKKRMTFKSSQHVQ